MYVDYIGGEAGVDGEPGHCLYVSEQLIICMLTQLSEALAQIPSAYELFDDPLATSFASTLVQKLESCGRCIDEF